MSWFWLGLLSCAVATSLALWLLGRPWAVYRPSLPPEGGTGEPPWWPWVCAFEPIGARFVTWRMKHEFPRWRQQAGMHARWEVTHWFTARVLLAGAGAVLLLGLWFTTDLPPHWGAGAAAAGVLLGFLWPQHALRRRTAQRRQRMARELPFMLDLLTLCVEAGLSLSSALRQVADDAPAGALSRSLREAAALERTGMGRAQWLAHWADVTDVPGVRSLVLTLAQADRLGMSLGPLLRAQAARQRSERFLRAEKLALEAPVRMLFPMVLCIFPCTFLVIGFPVLVKLMAYGF